MNIIVIDTDGTITTHDVATENRLEQLQQLGGGYIQVLDLTPDLAMILNEEGKIARLAQNATATRLTQHFAVGLLPGDTIVGPAVLAGQRAGETTEVPDVAADTLRRLGFPVP